MKKKMHISTIWCRPLCRSFWHMNDALMESNRSAAISRNEYGKQYFAQMDLQKKTFCEENIPLMQQESKTVQANMKRSWQPQQSRLTEKRLNLYGVQKYFEHEDQ